jgi:hypothetical protein
MGTRNTLFRRITAVVAFVALSATLTAGPASASDLPQSPAPLSTFSIDRSPVVTAPGRTGSGSEVQGVKSWIVKQVLRGVAGMIRGGASKFIDVGGDFLDAGAKSALRNHSGRIADVIEDVADIPDIATHMVRSEVYNGLKGFLGHGTANVIANAVEGVMWFAL